MMPFPDGVTCETEPIRTPGAIQPHGALLVLSNDTDLIVKSVSENCPDFIGIAAQNALGQPVINLLGSAAVTAANTLREETGSRQFFCDVNGSTFDCLCYRTTDGFLCIELEREAPDITAARAMLQHAQQGLAALRTLPDVDAIAKGAASLVQALTGFDRVMVYRFDADWNGEVVAEACVDGVESYLGLNFPASDIPRQARELYLLNRVRQIPDSSYRPVALMSATADSITIDLGQSQLRSVSPLHIEYMKNMGVRASLVCSLISGGRLWGLLSCHQLREGKYFLRSERELFAWICEDLSSQLTAALNQRLLDDKYSRAAKRQRLLTAMYEGGFAGLMINGAHDDLLSIVNADGFALVTDAGIEVVGRVPAVPHIEAMQARRRERSADPTLFHSHALTADLGLEISDDRIAGALFLSLHHRPDATMIWFRVERDHAVIWGGNPDNPHEIDDQRRISPRRSFTAFRQVIQGCSQPWSAEEIDAAAQLGAFIEIEVQRGYKSRLDNSETIYRSVVNAMAEGMVAQTTKGEIITCNSRAEQILGLSADQMMGRSSLDPRWRAIHENGVAFSGRDHPAMMTLHTGKPCQNVIMGVHKPDESLTWISINTEPLIQKGDNVVHGVVSTFLDVTERKRLQSEDLAARIIATQEQERARLSHDLHDEVGQSLTALKINLARAKHSCANAAAVGCFNLAQQITERLMSDVRSLAHQLRPSELDELGLVPTLRSHLDKVIRPLGLFVTLHENIGELRFSPEVELCCFRIIQEALTNCVRHAQATRVDVMVKMKEERLTLSVRDDGIGFDVLQTLEVTANTNSLGLVGMRERVAVIGGQVRINSSPGRGAEILVSCAIEGKSS
jgi:PAS domain S-box-containing protein